MTFMPPINHEDCTPGYGGCTCMCHRIPGVRHVMPCCYPSEREKAFYEEEGLYHGPVIKDGKPVC
jgi:hypothetical protein